MARTSTPPGVRDYGAAPSQVLPEGAAQAARSTTAPVGLTADQLAALANPPPPAPTGVIADGGDTIVDLIWDASGGATSYNVYRGTAAGAEAEIPVATGISALTWQDTGRVNGTAYFYKVAAVGAGGIGPKSAEVTATPAA